MEIYDNYKAKGREGKRQRAKGCSKGSSPKAQGAGVCNFCLLPSGFCLKSAFCLLPSAFCLNITLCLFIAFCLIPSAYSSKPVTVIVSLTPPYTPFLNEYGSSGVNKLQVSLLVNDSRMINYAAKLQMLVEHVGSGIVMRTSEYAAIAPILLTGNVTEVLNGFDLNKYLLAQNNVFTGFDQSQYLQTGRIPDGQYRIGFRVVDAQRSDVILSNTAYTQAGWFVLNDPPQINLPRNKEKVRVNELQNVKLEWFPRHLGSLNSAFATSYKIEIFAIRMPGMNPNQVAMTLQPDFTDVSNRTNYYLTSDKYLLEPGVEYAYRIKAMAGEDQLTLFQNNGYSEVFSFIYGSLCPEPENVSTKIRTIDKVELAWDTDPLQTSFETRFRKAGQVNDNWHSCESFSGTTEIANVLSPGVKYEYQVKATCTNVESEYCALDYFTMPYPANENFECGLSDSVAVSNRIPKVALQPGEMIFYGKFPIKLTEVSGRAGMFTGKGRMRIPFLASIQVNMQFTNIKVNELNEVYEGELVSIYNPDSKFLIGDVTDYFAEGDQIGNIIDGVDSAAITLGFPIGSTSNLTVNISGNTVTVNSGGQSTTATIENPEEGTTLKDSNGNLFVVDKKGKVTEVGKSGDFSTNDSKNNISNAIFDGETVLVFENAGDWALDGYDATYANSKFTSEYEEVNGYFVPWKFMPLGKGDKVKARLVKGNVDLKKIKFKTPMGTEFYAKKNGSELELTLIGAKQRDGYELFALYEENDTTTRTIGKINIASYPLLTRYVTIVPMQSGSIDKSVIETTLNEIYKPYGITWEVSIADIFTDRSWDTDNNGLKGAGTEFYSAFTDEMRALNAKYTKQRGVDSKSVYLFWFAQNAEGAENMLGDMPLESRFGYIFSPTITDKTHQTIAHELAHGVFQLRHTLGDKYNIDKNSTNNLMDYSGGTKLTKYQWDLIHDPESILFAWAQDEKEAEMMNGGTLLLANIADYINQIRQGNKDKKSELPMKITTGLGEYDKIIFGNKDYSYIKMGTIGFTPLTDKEPTTTIQTNTGQVTIPTERPSYSMKPSELSKTTYTENSTKYTKYQFHELQTKQNNAPYADTKETTGIARVEISVKTIESVSFEEYLYPMDDVFLENVTWVSQFDENIFGLCSGCWTTSCCRRAAEYMMGNTNIANCTDAIIAQNAPNMAVTGNITTSSFSDNTSKYTKDSYNSATLNYNSSNLDNAINYVKDRINAGRPVLIGVHYDNGNSSPPNNSNRATRHFMIIVGIGMEGENVYFRFYDPGRTAGNQSNATSPNNKLLINRQQGSIQGNYNSRTYTLTEIIKTN